MKKLSLILMVLVVLLAISACTAGPNELAGSSGDEGDVAGFWRGLWHGFISPFAFIASLFLDNINIYEVANNGNWYNFGFMIGASAIFGGGGGGAARRRKWTPGRL